MHSLDISVFYLLNNLAGQSSLVDHFIVFCADYLAYILAAAFFVFAYLADASWKGRIRITIVAGIATLLSRGVITELIRHFYHRPRPFAVLQVHKLIDDSAWSFPSGHATFFFALSTVVFLYNRRWGTWFFITSAVITLARVAAGVHYPSDILGGAIIGVFCGYFTHLLLNRFCPKEINQTY